jgi:hypothetical protein
MLFPLPSSPHALSPIGSISPGPYGSTTTATVVVARPSLARPLTCYTTFEHFFEPHFLLELEFDLLGIVPPVTSTAAMLLNPTLDMADHPLHSVEAQ